MQFDSYIRFIAATMGLFGVLLTILGVICLKVNRGAGLLAVPWGELSVEQLKNSAKLRRQYEDLKKWGAEPTPISHQTIKKFLDTVRDGLMHEAHRRPAHKLHYIDWALNAIDVQLRMFNKQLKISR